MYGCRILPAISSTDLGFFENTAVQASLIAHNGFVIASAVVIAVFCSNLPGVLVGFIQATLFLARGNARFAIVPIWFAVSSVPPALLTT